MTALAGIPLGHACDAARTAGKTMLLGRNESGHGWFLPVDDQWSVLPADSDDYLCLIPIVHCPFCGIELPLTPVAD